jgi:hypothetical protein
MKNWFINLLKIWITNLDPDIIISNTSEFKQPEIEPQSEETKPEEDAPKETVISPEDYWNSKWERKPIIYYGRIHKKGTNKVLQSSLLQTPVDVRAFILSNDELMKQIIARYNLIKHDWDSTMLAIQNFVVFGMFLEGTSYAKPFLSYVGDIETNDTYEYWQFPFETIESHVGDCEDGAILMTALGINAGIPSYRLKVAAGDVTNREYVKKNNLPDSYISEGGHAYCIYLASDNQWRILDWCYYNDASVPMLSKPLAKNGGFENCYKDTWFTFNDQYSWNQKELDIKVAHISEIGEKDELSTPLPENFPEAQ